MQILAVGFQDAAAQAANCSHLAVPTDPAVKMNDNRTPAGTTAGAELSLRLVVQRVSWYPDGPAGCAIGALALAEEGSEPSIPGPMIRVRAGTHVRVAVRNPLDEAILVGGLHDRNGEPHASTRIEAGRTKEFVFHATKPGSYAYGARVATGRARVSDDDRQLAGALIVEQPEGSRPDRVLVLTRWNPPGHESLEQVPESAPSVRRFELNVINGRSWPNTERLTYTAGDTVRLRVINAGGDAHLMHLHGFHHRVTSRGDNVCPDTVFAPGDAPLVVTDPLLPFQTMTLEWVPTRPGNWIFHCHFQRHMSAAQRLDRMPGAAKVSHEHRANALHDMAGLITGLTVNAAPGYVASAERPRHRLRLFANARARVFGPHPGYGFVLQQGERAPPPDSIRIPGSPLLLRQGEPTEIVVHNRVGKPLSVHWHGLELESYFDGVAGWSGMPGSIAPPIAPGDSFVVRITPPRAGTFIYHVHNGGPRDLSSGLYGAFIVLDADAPRVLPESDRLFVVSRVPGNDTATVVNGTRTPEPVDVVAGVTYRLRFIGIMPSEGDRFTSRDPAGIARWDVVARDGVEGGGRPKLPGLTDGVAAGMTTDYHLTASAPGEVVIELRPFDSRGRPAPGTIRIPVRVRARPPDPAL